MFFGTSPTNTIQYIQYIRWKENFQDPSMEPSSEPQVPTPKIPSFRNSCSTIPGFQHSEGRSKKGFIYKFYGQHVSSHQDVSKYLKNYAICEMSNVQNPDDVPLDWLVHDGILLMAYQSYHNPYTSGVVYSRINSK